MGMADQSPPLLGNCRERARTRLSLVGNGHCRAPPTTRRGEPAILQLLPFSTISSLSLFPSRSPALPHRGDATSGRTAAMISPMRTLLRILLACCLTAAAWGKPTLYILGDSTVRNQTAGTRGWGGGAGRALRPREDRSHQPRHRRPQQPNFPYRRPLGRRPRQPEARRFRPDAVRPQRRRRAQRRPLPRLDPRQRRRERGHRTTNCLARPIAWHVISLSPGTANCLARYLVISGW